MDFAWLLARHGSGFQPLARHIGAFTQAFGLGWYVPGLWPFWDWEVCDADFLSARQHGERPRSGVRLVWFQRVEQRAGFGDHVFGLGGGQGPAEDALRGELGSSFGVAGYQLHEFAGVDAGVRERGRRACFLGDGEADVQHLHELLYRLLLVAVGIGQLDLGAFTVELGDA